MNTETVLLKAAKAMGFYAIQPASAITGALTVVKNLGGSWVDWNPRESSADCAEMEDALDIVHKRYGWDTEVKSIRALAKGHHTDMVYFSDHPNKGAARRYASAMVAAIIGSKM